MKRVIRAAEASKQPKIEMQAGYYEFNIYIDDVLVFTADSDCAEDWFEYKNDTVSYAEMFVDGIIEELKDDARASDDWEKYDLVEANKAGLIKVVAEFVQGWVED